MFITCGFSYTVILLTFPWHVSQLIPAAMWGLCTKCTKSGTCATGTHGMGLPDFTKAASLGSSVPCTGIC
jgi:hypothetical protein